MLRVTVSYSLAWDQRNLIRQFCSTVAETRPFGLFFLKPVIFYPLLALRLANVRSPIQSLLARELPLRLFSSLLCTSCPVHSSVASPSPFHLWRIDPLLELQPFRLAWASSAKPFHEHSRRRTRLHSTDLLLICTNFRFSHVPL